MSYQGPPSPMPIQVPPGCIGCNHCGYLGAPRVVSHGGEGPSGCLTLVLLCFGIVPGLLYLAFGGTDGAGWAYCPRCNAPFGPWARPSNAKTLLIVAGVVLAVVAAVWVTVPSGAGQ